MELVRGGLYGDIQKLDGNDPEKAVEPVRVEMLPVRRRGRGVFR